jgi:hypothetical protein
MQCSVYIVYDLNVGYMLYGIMHGGLRSSFRSVVPQYSDNWGTLKGAIICAQR